MGDNLADRHNNLNAQSCMILYLGSPLSGKTTAAKECCIELQGKYLHPVDIVRKQLKLLNGTKIPKLQNLEFNNIIISEIKKSMLNSDLVILDGYPRDSESYSEFCELVDKINIQVYIIHVRLKICKGLIRWLFCLKIGEKFRNPIRFFVYLFRERNVINRLKRRYPKHYET